MMIPDKMITTAWPYGFPVAFLVCYGLIFPVGALTSTTAAASGNDTCNLAPDPGHCRWPSVPSLRWFYSHQRKECLAFTYWGCGGNGNRFKTSTDCSARCAPYDGPACPAGYPSVPEIRGNTTSNMWENATSSTCQTVQCPAGYKCKRGWRENQFVCCNQMVHALYTQAHAKNGLCRNGTIPSSYEGATVVGSSCWWLRCPIGYRCFSNGLYVNCCPVQVQGRRPKRAVEAVGEGYANGNATSSGEDRPQPWVKSGKFQGDIAGFESQESFEKYVNRVNKWQEWAQSKSNDSERFASAIRDPRGLWDEGRVPYVIESVSNRLRTAVDEAIRDIHASTCVRFIPRTNEAHYLRIVDDNDWCWSYVGKRWDVTGGQVLSGPERAICQQ